MNRINMLNKKAKKALAICMATALACTTTSIGTFIVEADDPYEDMYITDFDTLSESVAYQKLMVGSSESDIVFPTSLSVTFLSFGKKDSSSGASSAASSASSEASSAASSASTESSSAASSASSQESTEGTSESSLNGASAASAAENSGEVTNPEAAGEATVNEDAATTGSDVENTEPAGNAETPANTESGDNTETPANTEPETTSETEQEVPAETQPSSEPAPSTEEEPSQPENAEPENSEPESTDGTIVGSAINSFNKVRALSVVYAMEDDLEELSEGTRAILEDITWTLDESASSHNQFLSFKENVGDYYTYVPVLDEYEISENAVLPRIRVTIIPDETEEEKLYPFNESVTIDGITISVSAPEGVFPEGAFLEVSALGGRDDLEYIEGELSGRISEDKEIEDIISFDITIFNKDGEKIEPDTNYGEVSVTFSQLGMAQDVSEDDNAELRVYHFSDDSGSVDEVGADVNGDTVEFTTNSFSTYTIIKITDSKTNAEIDISVTGNDSIYDGLEHTLVTIGDYDASKITISDFAIKYTDTLGKTTSTTSQSIPKGIAAGQYDITINCKDSAGKTSANVVTANIVAKSISTTTMELTPSDGSNQFFKYNGGNEVKPKVTITDYIDGTEYVLKEGTDYTVAFSNNKEKKLSTDTDAPTVAVTGKGNYTGSLSQTFSIGDEIAASEILVTACDAEYTGASIPLVTLNGTYPSGNITAVKYSVEKEAETDTIPEAIAADIYEVKVRFCGKEGYCDYVKTLNCRIRPKDISGMTVVLVESSTSTTPLEEYAYTGSPVEPIAKVTDGTTELSSGIDYIISYENNTAVAKKTAAKAPTVVVTGKGNYTGVIKTKFSIVGSSGDITVMYNSSTTKKDWYTGDVVVTVPGYNLSTAFDGAFQPKYTITGEGMVIGAGLYLKNTSTGEVLSSPITATVNIDRTAPTGTVRVGDHSSSKINTSKEIAFYTRERRGIHITYDDVLSGVTSVEYYISSKLLADSSDIETAAKNKWIKYTESTNPKIADNDASFVCVRIQDVAGNIAYVSTKGIIHDTEGPTIKSMAVVQDGSVAHIKAVASDKLSGVAKYYLIQYEAAYAPSSKPDADTVKGGYSSDKGEFDIPADSTKSYVYYAVAEDKVENLGEVYKKGKNGGGSSTASSKASGATSLAATPNGIAGGGASGSGAGGSSQGSKTSGNKNSSKEKSSGSSDSGKLDLSQIEIKRDPYIYDATGNVHIGEELTSTWPSISSEVKRADEGATISVDMRGTSNVPATFISNLQNKDVDVILKMADDYRWTINGTSVTDIESDGVDLRVTANSRNIPSSLISQMADSYPHYEFNIAHDGEFGFTARLTMNVNKANAGLYGNLYYYDPSKGELNLVDSSKVDNNGDVSYELGHASDYTVIVKPTVAGAIGDPQGLGIAGTIEDYTNVPTTRSTGLLSAGKKFEGIRNWLIAITIISIALGASILFIPGMQDENFRFTDFILNTAKRLNFNKQKKDPWDQMLDE
ncbi:Cell pole-organizing protein PopZ [Butyrivibrio sp. Su6]|uniref:hypothetical protein n=1 Tax=Butyrivibrio sp. Su6 TaxID=1520810 RepID=UPI00089F7C05|nr:hypothetical protein [Butyrivibrio sp. Su6]SEF38975.1 Cell pole-organizing protein PopZ [Butyrivibrio sp. Su6]